MGNQFKDVAIIAGLRTFLFVFNIAFWVTGFLLLVLGFWVGLNFMSMDLSDFFAAVPSAYINVAILIVTCSSFAFCFLLTGKPSFLFTYGGLLACIFVMNVGFGAALVCHRDSLVKGLRDVLTHGVHTHNTTTSNLDLIQSKLQCCGVSSYKDWVQLSPQRVIPISCCVDVTRCVTANYSDVYQNGCYESILENSRLLISVAVGMAVLPLAGTILACSLGYYLKKQNYNPIS